MGVDIRAKIVKGYWISEENMKLLSEKNALTYLTDNDNLHWGDHYDDIEVQEGIAGICVNTVEVGYLKTLESNIFIENEWEKEELRAIKSYLRKYIYDIDEYELQTFVLCQIS